MRPNGTLAPAGVAYIQRNLGSRLDGEDIQRIFDPDSDLTDRTERGLRLQWREEIVAADVRSTMGVRRARLDDAGEIVFTGTQTPGLFASTDGSKFVLVDWTLSEIFEFLKAARAVAVTEETFSLPEVGDMRPWTVARFFAHTLRANHDPDFVEAYAKTHVHYLSVRYRDPLQMVRPADIAPGPLQGSRMSLQQFWGLAAQRLPGTSERRNRADRRANLDDATARRYSSGLPYVSDQIRLGAQHWFSFLFGAESFVGDIASELLRTKLGDASSLCDGLESAPGIKLIGAKRPDIVQIHAGRRHIEVVDATMRPHDRWHNFKTEFYAAALRAVVGNIPDQDWIVGKLDFRSQWLVDPA